MGYRVVHCGTGNIGAAALRAILQHPDLELVGHYVSTPAKAARDSGAVVGAVCEAEPGLLSPLDVPRYWARSVAARTS